MAIHFPELDTVVTAAPGTGSTSLLEACRRSPMAVDLVASLGDEAASLDAKHATVTEIVASTSFSRAGQIVTTTRDPHDFYVAEWFRNRTRWASELDDPSSWVHRVEGARDAIELARAHDFTEWLHIVLHDDVAESRQRRLNPGHVDEATIVLRMECLDDDLGHLHPELATEIGSIPHVNRTDRPRNPSLAYSDRTRRMVSAVHADDIATFGYGC